MEVADTLEEGEINAAGIIKESFSLKNSNEFENKENKKIFSGSDEPAKRRKLRDMNGETPLQYHSSMDFSSSSSKDSYIPMYKTRSEWMQIIKRRKQQSSMKDNNDDNILCDDVTPKSGSETISDEHLSSFNSIANIKQSTYAIYDEASQDNIEWPSWLDPAGKFSAKFSPLPEFKSFLKQTKEQNLKKRKEWREQIGDSLQPIDVSLLKQEKAVLSGDGWKRMKDGSRTPNIFWQFLKQEKPMDPRGDDYLQR